MNLFYGWDCEWCEHHGIDQPQDMTDAAVPILLGTTIFLCLNFGASTETIDEEVEPQTSLNGYYLDSLIEVAAGLGYVL